MKKCFVLLIFCMMILINTIAISEKSALNEKMTRMDYDSAELFWIYRDAVIMDKSKATLSKEEAIEKAENLLLNAFAYPEEIVNSSSVQTCLFSSNELMNSLEPLWLVKFEVNDEVGYDPTFVFTQDGRLVLDKKMGVTKNRSYCFRNLQWENNNIVISSMYDGMIEVCVKNDFQEAKNEMMRFIGETIQNVFLLSEDRMTEYAEEIRFIYSNKFMMGIEPVWYITYKNMDNANERIEFLFTYDGKFLGFVDDGSEFRRPYLYREEPWTRDILVNEKGETFKDWSVKAKAAFSEKWKPVVDEYCEQNYFYSGAGDEVFNATRFRYGRPSDDDISQKEAIKIAEQAILESGAEKDVFECLTRCVFFDVSIPEKPIWKIWYHFQAKKNMKDTYTGDISNYYVMIDAREGEVLEISTMMLPFGWY